MTDIFEATILQISRNFEQRRADCISNLEDDHSHLVVLWKILIGLGKEVSVSTQIEGCVMNISLFLKSSIAKLLLQDDTVLVIQHVTLSLKIVNHLLSQASTSHEASEKQGGTAPPPRQKMRKASLELLMQSCYVLLNHYTPSMKKVDLNASNLSALRFTIESGATRTDHLSPENYRNNLTSSSSYLPPALRKMKEEEVLFSQSAQWKEIKNEFFLQLLRFIHCLCLLDLGFFWANIPLFFTESFKIDKLFETTVLGIHQTLTADPSEPNAEQKQETKNIGESLAVFFNEIPKFQCFLFYCLFQVNHSLQSEAIQVFSDIFLRDFSFIRRWLPTISSSSLSSSSFLFASSSIGSKIQKTITKILQSVCIFLFTHCYQSMLVPADAFPLLDLSTYSRILRLFGDFLSVLPITPLVNSSLDCCQLCQTINNISSFEVLMSVVFEVVMINCFLTRTSNDAQVTAAVPKRQTLIKDQDLAVLSSAFFASLSSVAEESLKWLVQWTKSYSNNRKRCFLPLFANALLRSYRLNILPTSVQRLVSIHSGPPSLTGFDFPHSRINSIKSMSLLRLWNRLLFYTIQKKSKHSLIWLQIACFFIQHYLPLYFLPFQISSFGSSADMTTPVQEFLQSISVLSESTIIEEQLLFLDYIESILHYEQSCRHILLRLEGSNDSSIVTVQKLLNLLMTYLASGNHLLIVKTCESIGALRLSHWNLIASNRKFFEALVGKLFDLASDAVGNVRSAVYRCLGETISRLNEIKLENDATIAQTVTNDVLISCRKGCQDSKLSVRIQAAFALNKCLVYRTSAVLQVYHDNHLLLDEFYKIYQQLLADSDKIATTAVLGLGYLVHLEYGTQLSASNEETAVKSIKIEKLLRHLYHIASRHGHNQSKVFKEMNRSEWIFSVFTMQGDKKLICATCQTTFYVLYHLLVTLLTPCQPLIPDVNTDMLRQASEIITITIQQLVDLLTIQYLQLQTIVMKALTLLLPFLLQLTPFGFRSDSILSEIHDSVLGMMQRYSVSRKDSKRTFSSERIEVASSREEILAISRELEVANTSRHQEESVRNSTINVVLHRQDSLQRLLLQFLYLEFHYQEDKDASQNHSESTKLLLILSFLENIVQGKEALLQQLFQPEDPPIIPSLDHRFDNPLSLTVQVALIEIASALLRKVERSSVIDECSEISSVLLFRLRSLARIDLSFQKPKPQSPAKYNRFDGLQTNPQALIDNDSSHLMGKEMTSKAQLIGTVREQDMDIDEF